MFITILRIRVNLRIKFKAVLPVINRLGDLDALHSVTLKSPE